MTFNFESIKETMEKMQQELMVFKDKKILLSTGKEIVNFHDKRINVQNDIIKRIGIEDKHAWV